MNIKNLKPLTLKGILKIRRALLLCLILLFHFQCSDPSSQINYSSRVGELNSSESQIVINIPGLMKDAKELKMQYIPAGKFIMGSSPVEWGHQKDNEWTPHEVIIPKAFYIGIYEITQAQWEAVMGGGENPSKFKGKPNHPVEKVNWISCQRFLNKLNQLGQGKFRLPTEAEWEYACRAGTRTRFFWGDSINEANKFMWWRGNSPNGETHAVGLKSPNPWGLYDTLGNVSEWCADGWQKPYLRMSYKNIPSDFSKWEYLLFLKKRIFRGGSFYKGAENCRSASRYFEQQVDYHYSLGLRVVRE